MSNPHGPPRRVSLGYVLGFGDKPFKDAKPFSPPRPRRPSQLAELVASPGGIVEWTASDGRKGKLTGTGKPRLTAATLAKVPSNTRSAKAPTDAKAASKKAASSKHLNDLVDGWNSGNSGFIEEKKRSKQSVSKKAASNKEDPWGPTAWDDGGSAKASQKAASGVGKASNSGDVADPWGPQVVVADVETKQDEQKKTSVASGQAVAPDAAKDDSKKPDDSNAWNKDQDEKMLQMKTETGNIAWDTVAISVGKPAKECKERWKLIMPTGWKPNDAKKRSDKGDAGKKADVGIPGQKGSDGSKKGADEKGNKDADDPWVSGFEILLNEASDNKEDEEKKSSGWDNGNDGGGDTIMGWDFANAGDSNQAKDDANSWGNIDGASDANKDGGVAWDQSGGDTWGQTDGDTTAAPWDTPNNPSNDDTQGWLSSVKPASAPHSNKVASEARTHRTNTSNSKPTPNSPAEIELEPDDNFSADDLRLIARILQQDCSLVWNRVSWRFRDKTGRTLHPDVFEKKINGTVESKSNGSESGDRKK